MVYLVVRHNVEDFSRWKPAYDAHASVRKEAGCKNEQLLRSSDNPNSLVIVFEWDSIDNARRFSESEELKQTMKNAGVIGMPEFLFLEEIECKVTGEDLEERAA